MVTKKEEGLYNSDLKRAVKYLYKQDIISADKDIAEKMNLSKGTVSGYLTGRVEASKPFRTKFEEVFELSLKDFTEAGDALGNRSANGKPPVHVPVSWLDYIKLIQLSLEQIKKGQNEILDQQVLTRAEVRGYGKYHLVKDAKGKREKFDKLLAEVDKLVNDELLEDDTQDNPSGT